MGQKLMPVGEGVVLIDNPSLLIRAKYGNKFEHKKIEGIKIGDKVWMFFSVQGELKKIEKIIKEEEIVYPVKDIPTVQIEHPPRDYEDEWDYGE